MTFRRQHYHSISEDFDHKPLKIADSNAFQDLLDNSMNVLSTKK